MFSRHVWIQSTCRKQDPVPEGRSPSGIFSYRQFSLRGPDTVTDNKRLWATSELFWGFYFPSQVGQRMSAEREQQPSGRHGPPGRNLWFPKAAAGETSTEIRGYVLPGSRGWQRQQIPAAFPIRGWECVGVINQTQQRRLSALRLCRHALSSPVKQHRCRTIASSSPSLDTVCLLLWLNL